MTRRRLLTWIAAGLIGLAACAAFSAWWVTHTEAGTRWSAERLATFAEGLTLTGVQGRWSDQVNVDTIDLDREDAALRLNGIELRIRLAALFRRHLAIELLEIERLEFVPGENTDPAPSTPRQWSPLPLAISLERASVAEFLGPDGTPVSELYTAMELSGDTLAVTALRGTSQGVDVEVSGRVLLDQGPDIQAELDWQFADSAASGSATVAGPIDQLEFRHQLETPFPVTSTGVFRQADGPHIELTSHADAIPFEDQDQLRQLEDVSASLIGWIDQYELTAEAGLNTADLPPVSISMQGRGDNIGLRIERLIASANGTRAVTSGSIGWNDGIRWQGKLSVNGMNASWLHPDLSGTAAGEAGFHGGMSNDAVTFGVDDLMVSGEIAQRPFELTGGFSLTDGEIVLNRVLLTSAENSVEAGGRLGANSALRFSARLNDMAVLGPQWEGAIAADGLLAGDVVRPRVDLELSARQLRIPGLSADAVQASGSVFPEGDRSRFSVEADRLVLGSTQLSRIESELAGSLASHQVNTIMQGYGATWTAEFQGGFRDGTWRGQHRAGLLRFPDRSEWRLRQPADMEVTAATIMLAQACYAAGNSSACLSGSAGDANLDLTGAITDLPLPLLNALLPAGARAAGRLDGEFRVTGTAAEPLLDFAAGTGPVRLVIPTEDPDVPVDTSIESLAVRGQLGRASLSWELDAGAAGGSFLRSSGRLNGLNSKDPVVDARIEAQVPDTSPLVLLTSELSDWQGLLTADLRVTGELLAPETRGSVRLRQGRAEIRRLGIALSDIEAEVTPQAGYQLNINANARSGEGSVRLDGRLALADGPTVEGTLRGQQFTAADLPGVRLEVAPSISFSGNAQRLALNGTLAASRFEVVLKDLPEQAISVSPDVVVAGEQDTVTPTRGPEVTLDLLVELGENVRFSAFGLDTKLAGQLRFKSEPGKAVTALGTVDVAEGTYRAYGQKLDIENGRLTFAGPLGDPGVSGDAVRVLPGVKAGIRLRGTGSSLESSVFSEPAMAESDALSYLILGRPLAEATRSEGDDLMNSAVALGLRQAMPIASQIGRSIGLDELGLDTDDTDGGAVMAGKKISPDLYVRYSYGIFNRLGALMLRYELNERLSLEAKSSQDQSLDLMYKRERR
ncbi:MAG: translocation/assembly module TamB domain-containing protein [Xanthomonadales bacterium]|nr:translocation/assembly module TamB domain-containing protein [Xanthomonadales bacterium]